MKYLLLYMFLLVCMNIPSITIGKLTKGLKIGTKDNDIPKAILRTAANYEMTDRGKLCDSDLGQNTIQTEAQCRHAASQLGRRFAGTINWERRKFGCIWMRRGRRYGVYFNTNPNPGTTGSRSTTSICSKGSCKCGVKGGRRIVGGKVAHPGEWPWIVLLVSGGTDGSKQIDGHCGGTLVASQWILTAAHCFFNERNRQDVFANDMSAVIGEHDLWRTNDRYDTKRKNLEIEKIEIHPKYKHYKRTFEYDIALLKLKPVDLSDYMKACLLPGGKDWSGNTAWVYGWGRDDSGDLSVLLREADLNIISNDDCKEMTGTYDGEDYDMEDELYEDMMCADMPGKDACRGDSGGSLTVEMNNKHYLAGIVSWGLGCATEGLPGVFVNVSYLREWIEETVNDNEGADFCSGLD